MHGLAPLSALCAAASKALSLCWLCVIMAWVPLTLGIYKPYKQLWTNSNRLGISEKTRASPQISGILSKRMVDAKSEGTNGNKERN